MIWSHFLNLNVRTSVFVLSHVWLFATPWTVTSQAPLSMEFSRQEYWSGLHFMLQGVFLTQRSNPCLLHPLHWQAGSLPLSHLGSPSWDEDHEHRNHGLSPVTYLVCAGGSPPVLPRHSHPVTLYSYSLTSWGWKKILESWPLGKVQRNENPFMFSRISLIVELKSTPLNWERK